MPLYFCIDWQAAHPSDKFKVLMTIMHVVMKTFEFDVSSE